MGFDRSLRTDINLYNFLLSPAQKKTGLNITSKSILTGIWPTGPHSCNAEADPAHLFETVSRRRSSPYSHLSAGARWTHKMKISATSYGVSERNSPKFSFLQQAAGIKPRRIKGCWSFLLYLHFGLSAGFFLSVSISCPDNVTFHGSAINGAFCTAMESHLYIYFDISGNIVDMAIFCVIMMS